MAHAETCPQYLLLDVDAYDEPGFDGAKYVVTPPLRESWNHAELWRGLRIGSLDVISTDHCPFCMKEQKELGRDDFSKIPNGGPGIENRMSLIYHHGVSEGRVNLNRFVELTSTAAAKIFGLFPKKGTIAVGSDADIVIFDPEREETISVHNPRTHHMNVDYSAYEGFRVKGIHRDGPVPGQGGHRSRGVRGPRGRRRLRQAGSPTEGHTHERERQRWRQVETRPRSTPSSGPRPAPHATKSVSGVLVESNVRGQLALHFYNEVRELEPQVEYMEDGSRADPPRSVTYVREITDSILLAGSTARQLRDVLDEFLSVSQDDRRSDS